MSVSMTKAEGVTILTLKSNTKSAYPPLFQILGSLCYSPVCCSVSVGLTSLQGSTLTALGTMQIMVGLLNIGLGSIVNIDRGTSVICPYLLGSLFIAFGVMCILAEKFPSPCLVAMNVSMNLVGIALAIVPVVIYAIDLGNHPYDSPWQCRKESYSGYDRTWSRYDYYQTTIMTTPSPMEDIYLEECRKGRRVLSVLFRGLDVLLITLALLQLCVNISTVVLGIKALKKNQKERMENIHDSEVHKSLMDEDVTNTTA